MKRKAAVAKIAAAKRPKQGDGAPGDDGTGVDPAADGDLGGGDIAPGAGDGGGDAVPPPPPAPVDADALADQPPAEDGLTGRVVAAPRAI